jgi:hypothetical protein
MGLYDIIVVLHAVSAAVGVGAAATSDAIFLRSIRNRLMSRDQFVLIRAASRVVVGGLTLLVLTGIFMMFLNTRLIYMPHFQAKMTVVVVLMVNGLVFHGRLLPFLKRHLDRMMPEKFLARRQWFFAITGAISAVSWFAALIIAYLGDIGMGYLFFIGIYIAAMAGGSIAGYFVLAHLIFWSAGKEKKPAGKGKDVILQVSLLAILLIAIVIVLMI